MYHRYYQGVVRAREICARGGLKDVSGDPTTELGEEPAINRGAVELADVGIQAQITLQVLSATIHPARPTASLSEAAARSRRRRERRGQERE